MIATEMVRWEIERCVMNLTAANMCVASTLAQCGLDVQALLTRCRIASFPLHMRRPEDRERIERHDKKMIAALEQAKESS